MSRAVATYLAQRPDTATFLLTSDLEKTLADLFARPATLLPSPYRIYPADETQAAMLGFPVAESPVLKDLETKLDRWLTDEVLWQVRKEPDAKEKAQLSFGVYIGTLLRLAENALTSNLLNDYNAVFWLAHSFDLSRHFSSIPRRVMTLDAPLGRTQGDALKYRIYSRWVSETREQMTQIAAKSASLLDGEEQRALQFFRLLQDDVLVLTEEFIGPDLRELRSFITGYLRRDFQQFRDSVERMREAAVDLLLRDKTFRAMLPMFGTTVEQGVSMALLLDPRFQTILAEQTTVQNGTTREEREQFQLIARRIREFSVLNNLRRGIVWMTTMPDGQIVGADRRGAASFSRSTRPLDYGRPGVVDPMVHRFGLIYDISAFTETLGAIRRSGGREEIRSYRQMLLFQRKLETIAQRHTLQFEKFLGDGAFYTTRRALALVRAAVEIQRFYAEMKTKGFAFNKGLRIAVNYGYYRLLPMKVSVETNERITEFYGPGIVELSRLTTGKANKEIEEIASFLIARGYEAQRVQQFFAPLSRGVDVIDHAQHEREFYAYVNANANLVNEGIVASSAFLQELSTELTNEGQQLQRLRTPFGTYIGFAPSVSDLEYVGIRLLGTISLKGLDNLEIGEIAPFAKEDVEATPLTDPSESLLTVLRQEFHRENETPTPARLDADTTTEREIPTELVICVNEAGDEVILGEWDPRSDDLRRPLRLPRADFQSLFSLKGELTTEVLERRRESIHEMYQRLSERTVEPPVSLAEYREGNAIETYLIGTVVEKL